MNYFFDTSVLISAFLDGHVHQKPSLAAFSNADRKSSCCAAHSLAEVYSVLTRLPGEFRVDGSHASLFLENIAARLSFIALDSSEYWSTIMNAAEMGVTGGRIYDALLARCALKARAEVIYTWDLTHYLQLGDDVAQRVRTP